MRKASRRRGALPGTSSLGLGPTKEIMKMGSSYPIDEILPAVRAALDATGRLVIEAPPGAGKSTRVPPVLRDALGGKVVICQPRRLAARSVAARVAELEQSLIGDAVGYRVRFDRKVSARTTLEFVTTGLLLRQVAAGDQLDGVAAVVLDEFHERSLDSDLLIGLMKRLQAGPRPELVLVVMSATLDREVVMEYLPGAQVLTSEGRRFPVATHYQAGAGDLQAVACGAIKMALEQSDGHVLVFLPGQGAIHRVRRTLGERGDYGCEVRPVWQPSGRRAAGRDCAGRQPPHHSEHQHRRNILDRRRCHCGHRFGIGAQATL
jgi:ATP-dependent helicase HrpB